MCKHGQHLLYARGEVSRLTTTARRLLVGEQREGGLGHVCTTTLPLVRSIDPDRASADPLDYELWPHDRTRLINELWALALANLATLKKFDAKVVQDARLSGRNLEPWRAILAVAAWLDTQEGADELQRAYDDPEDQDAQVECMGGLLARLEALSVAYQALT